MTLTYRNLPFIQAWLISLWLIPTARPKEGKE